MTIWNRRTRALLPMTDRLLEPALRTKLQYAKYQQAAYYNRCSKEEAIFSKCYMEKGAMTKLLEMKDHIK